MSDRNLPAAACALDQHEGEALRFGPDEADPGDIPIAIEAGTEVPGWGFAESKVVLKRPPGFDTLDANLLANGKIYDEAGETISMGRVVGFPRVGVTEIEIDFEGPLAHLDDDTTAAMVFRDTSFANWTGGSAARKAALAASYGVSDPTVTFDPGGNPAIELKFSGTWTNAQIAEACYDAGAQVRISEIYAEWLRNAFAASTGFIWEIGAGDDDVFTNYTGSGDLQAEPATTGTKDQLFTTPQRMGRLALSYGTAAGADGFDFAVYFSKVAVYGNHGLTKRGTEPAAGFYGSDVVLYALGRWAPLISIAPNGIEQASFVIPHLAFLEKTTARAMIEAVSLFGASGDTPPDWGYYEDGFFWKTPGTYGRTWRLRRDEGTDPEDDGPSSSTSCNGFIVAYTDSGGSSHTVGPPGSGCDYETSLLQDTSPTNPVNAAGIPRRYGSRSIGTDNILGATRMGQLLMADANAKKRSGSATVSGWAKDEAGNELPAYMIRAGDLAVIEDDEDTTPVKIVSTNYADGTLTASLDNQGNRIEGLLARHEVGDRTAGF